MDSFVSVSGASGGAHDVVVQLDGPAGADGEVRVGSSAAKISHWVASSAAVTLAAVTDTSSGGWWPWPCCSWLSPFH